MLDNTKQQALTLIQKYGSHERPTILLGLSGGPDSVFLLLVLQELHHDKKINLMAVHLDHQWRDNSADDVAFCKQLCELYNIPFEFTQADTLQIKVRNNGSLEEVGRKIRRHYFEVLLKKHDAQCIALAHHRQDQQETFFMRLFRGSSLAGLTCMKEYDKPYLRLLLNVNKQEIIKYLEEQKITYLTDPSNTSDNFLRNRIRKQIIPSFNECDERFDKKFDTTLEHLTSEHEFLNRLTQQAFDTVFVNHYEKFLKGDLATFRSLDPVLQKRLIIMWLIKQQAHFTVSHRFINEIIRFLSNTQGGRHQLTSTWLLKKQGKFFWIEHKI